MENACDYFLRTENTVRVFLKEYQACKAKVRLIQELIIQGDPAPDLKTRKITFGEWWIKNKNDRDIILKAHQKYSTEAFACGLLAGSVLKIAARAIEHYSGNTAILEEWEKILDKKFLPSKFFIGRTIHTVPLGLLIYAGWNQYIDPISREIRVINQQIFRQVATHSKLFEFESFADLDFNFINLHSEYFASNVIDVLCWNDYDHYIGDMQQALF